MSKDIRQPGRLEAYLRKSGRIWHSGAELVQGMELRDTRQLRIMYERERRAGAPISALTGTDGGMYRLDWSHIDIAGGE